MPALNCNIIKYSMPNCTITSPPPTNLASVPQPPDPRVRLGKMQNGQLGNYQALQVADCKCRWMRVESTITRLPPMPDSEQLAGHSRCQLVCGSASATAPYLADASAQLQVCNWVFQARLELRASQQITCMDCARRAEKGAGGRGMVTGCS